MYNKNYGGIDPGKMGAIAVLQKNGVLVTHPFPLIGKSGNQELDLKGLANFFRSIKHNYPDITFVMEEVHSLYGMSASSNFTFGWNNGLLVGMLNAFNFSYTFVQPKKWQAEIWVNSDKMNHVVKGKTKLDTKGTSSNAAARIYPGVDFTPTERSKKDHDGMVDAALLAKYAQQKNL